MISAGNNSNLELGIQISNSLFFTNARSFTASSPPSENGKFEINVNLSQLNSGKIYYRAYARNQLFESFGNKKRFKLPEVEQKDEFSIFPNATAVQGNWKENWMGVFQEYSNGWIYHIDLGWCFASPDSRGNVWLWISDHGWVWTNDSTWPHLYRNQSNSWLYLLIRQTGPAVIFDHMHGSFMHLNK